MVWRTDRLSICSQRNSVNAADRAALAALQKDAGAGPGSTFELGYIKPGSAGSNGNASQIAVEASKRIDWPELSGMLRNALNGKGNFGIGSGNREQAQAMGEAWVGSGYTTASNGKILISADGLRQYRPPATKENSPFAATGTQANFERREFPNGNWTHNGHLDVKD